ncbi:hypothetical protein MLD38_017055 [Melastoma candidum]|uniref:Uncharacterized protein n=1 Tax=Melastoma candidum TaxID=119954 RepID=A0ACB9QPK2_9MYRT|nr:hypothetical protein MLD38_017055 [Melastoma candidum]
MEPMDEAKNHNLYLINLAIQKLLEDRRASRDAVLIDIDFRLLSQLLSQFQWVGCSDHDNTLQTGGVLDIEHCRIRSCTGLFSAVIVITVAWQLSEVALVLKVKKSLSHPFRLLGKLVNGFFRYKASATEGDADNEKSLTAEQDQGWCPASHSSY